MGTETTKASLPPTGSLSATDDNIIVGTKTAMVHGTTGRMLELESSIFSPNVRLEWINAMFGPDFFASPDYTPQRTGIGLSKIPSYVCYQVKIEPPPEETDGDAKLGVTISRIPLGVYVRGVDVDGEAYAAGIIPGSVLISINETGVLGDPTHKLLEKLWWYEGHCSAHSENGNSNENSGRRKPGPIAFKLIKDGVMYTAILLGKAPFGVSWAPCGNFALVQRTYSYAQKAGVRRGCLVAAVNGRNLRNMDHEQTASVLRDSFISKQTIHLTCCYTPSDSRSGSSSKNSSAQKSELPTDFRDNNGVRLRRTESPTGYGSGSFFICGANRAYMPGPGKNNGKDPHNNLDSIAELAIQVAAGNLEAPTGLKRTLNYSSSVSNMSFSEWVDDAQSKSKDQNVVPARHFQTIGVADPRQNHSPSLNFDQLIIQWDPLDALLFCLSRHRVSYNEQAWITEGGVIGKSKDKRLYTLNSEKSKSNSNERLIPLHTVDANKQVIKSFCTIDHVEMLGLYVPQFISLLSSVDLCKNILLRERVVSDISNTEEGSKTESKSLETQRIMSTVAIAEKIMVDLFEPIIQISLENSSYCQKVFYLMRSFTESMKEYNGTIQSKAFYSPLQVLQNIQQQLVTSLREDEHLANEDEHGFQSLKTNGHRSKTAAMPYLDRNGTMEDYSIWSGTSRMTGVETMDDDFDSPTKILSADLESKLSNISTISINRLNKRMSDNDISPLKLPINNDENNDSHNNNINEPKKKSKNKLMKLIKKSIRGKDSNKPGKSANATEELPQSFKSKVPVSASANQGSSTSPVTAKEPKIKKTKESTRRVQTSAPTTPKPNSILKKAPDAVPMLEGHENFHPMYLTINQTFSMSTMFRRMDDFLEGLKNVCDIVEDNLQQSISEKIAKWAMQPWSDSKDRTLADMNSTMRQALNKLNSLDSTKDTCPQNSFKETNALPLLNPLKSSELLLSLVPEECHILPSAHFPLLLSFNAFSRFNNSTYSKSLESQKLLDNDSKEVLYRTKIEFLAVKANDKNESNDDCNDFIVHAAMGGQVQETEKSKIDPYFGSKTHRWQNGNIVVFECRSRWGSPKTLSLRVSSTSCNDNGSDYDDSRILSKSTELGYSFIDLKPIWKTSKSKNNSTTESFVTKVIPYDICDFDQQGYSNEDPSLVPQRLEVELKITVESLPTGILNDDSSRFLEERRLLLFKHDDDMRQEMFAIQFIEICDRILKANGLDLKLKQYSCIPVGKNCGFIEWVSGTVPVSEICKPCGSALDNDDGKFSMNNINYTSDDLVNEIDGDAAQYSTGAGAWCKYESLRSLRQCGNKSDYKDHIGLNGNNPVQDFLRAHAYDADAPYYICPKVMDNYVKSCAGYCIITYILGVGDRHLENLLIHQNGYFLHCDYSFILGQDPKTYLPMRITEDMVNGMGGFESDNFSKFTSLAGAAFTALRQHSSVRILMSILRNLSYSDIPDIARNQTPYDAMNFLRNQFRLELDEDEAISFIENLIYENVSSKLWMAVDSIHSLSKRF